MANKTRSTSNANQNIMGAVAYLLWFITGILILLTEKNNKFIRFHAMQSTILFGGITIIQIVLGFVPVLGALVGGILTLVSTILWLVCMFKAYSGEMFKLPIVGDIAEEQLKKL